MLVSRWNPIALGVISYLAFNSPRMILIKDSAVTGLFGLVVLAYLTEAVARIALVYLLPVQVMVAVNGVLPLALLAALIFWTVTYARRSRARGVARNAPVAQPSALP